MPDLPRTRRDYDAREVVSALQKAVRRSEPHEAAYWATELAKSGFGNWYWKRVRVMVSEDIGPAAPGLAADVHALWQFWLAAEKNKGGESILHVIDAAIRLAAAPKSRIVDWAVWDLVNDFTERLEIPDHALDKHTAAGRRMGRGDQHFIDEASRLIDFDGDLEELEAVYLAAAEHMVEGNAESTNPWARFPTSGRAQMTFDARETR